MRRNTSFARSLFPLFHIRKPHPPGSCQHSPPHHSLWGERKPSPGVLTPHQQLYHHHWRRPCAHTFAPLPLPGSLVTPRCLSLVPSRCGRDRSRRFFLSLDEGRVRVESARLEHSGWRHRTTGRSVEGEARVCARARVRRGRAIPAVTLDLGPL